MRKKTIKVEPAKGPHIMINLMKCPECKTIYHWGVEGWGNCPACRKAQSKEEEPEDGI